MSKLINESQERFIMKIEKKTVESIAPKMFE